MGVSICKRVIVMKISFSSNDSVQIVGGDGLFSKQESVGRFWLKELSDHTHLLSPTPPQPYVIEGEGLDAQFGEGLKAQFS